MNRIMFVVGIVIMIASALLFVSTVVPYVMFFFAATGGVIGFASQAGKAWTITTVIVFLIMAVLAFVQRGITAI